MTFNSVLSLVGEFLWMRVGVFLLVGAGVLLTLRGRFFQFFGFPVWWRQTAGKLFFGGSAKRGEGALSQFGAVCTTLAATLGVGNIAGVASAIAGGGPGAVFWMWVAAFFGMMTSYFENTLGVIYRRKNKNGQVCGGAHFYLCDGVGGRIGRGLASAFALFTVVASFGVGNMSQVGAAASNLSQVVPVPLLQGVRFLGTDLYRFLLGAVLAAAAGAVILGGRKGALCFTERLVPVLIAGYILGALVLLFICLPQLPEAFLSIFRHAFALRPLAGGAVGFTVREAVSFGIRRGVFSNEAGLGSAVTVNASANADSPEGQGMWGMFEVFVDTILVCTLTALVILSSGTVDLESGKILAHTAESALVAEAFSLRFGGAGAVFIAAALLFFAFSTVVGWSFIGLSAWDFLFGGRGVRLYLWAYVLIVAVGANLRSVTALCIADIANALMMFPNLFGVLYLTHKQNLRVHKNRRGVF